MPHEENELLRRLRERRTRPAAAEPPTIVHPDDVIPDLGPDEIHHDDGLDSAIDSIDIIEAYRRWCGKSEPEVGKRREGIKIRCPRPDHLDRDPSAWINLDKQVWTCGTCGFEGGDKYDIAAWHFGFDVPGYKNDGSFPELRRAMAQDFGFVIRRTLGGQDIVESPEDLAEDTNQVPDQGEQGGPPTPVPEPPTTSQEPPRLASVTPLTPSEEQAENEFIAQARDIRLDWGPIVPENTFLDIWMNSCTVDDLPEEYYFWLGMQALGFAIGTNVKLYDFQPVKPNIYVCLYGPSGAGKSRALTPYMELMRSMAWDGDPFTASTGTKQLTVPGSSEALVKQFQHQLVDPADPSKSLGLAPVKGLLQIEEFAGFISRASRTGNPLKTTLTELYDASDKPEYGTTSLSGGDVKAAYPFCQAVTTTQPKSINSYLKRSDADSGFLNRWVFAVGTPRKELIPWGGVHIDVHDAARALARIRTWSDTPRMMQMRHDALDVWNPFFFNHVVPIRSGLQDDSMMSRLELHIKKCIILLTVNSQLENPTPEIVSNAVGIAPYLEQTLSLVGKDLTNDEFDKCSQAIESVLQAHPGGLTRVQLDRKINNRFSKLLVHQVLKMMAESSYLYEDVTKNKTGPKSIRYIWARTS